MNLRRASGEAVEQSDGQSDERQRGGTDGGRRAGRGEGLGVSEHPELLFTELLSVQLRTHQPPDRLVVGVQPLELETEQLCLMTPMN